MQPYTSEKMSLYNVLINKKKNNFNQIDIKILTHFSVTDFRICLVFYLILFLNLLYFSFLSRINAKPK